MSEEDEIQTVNKVAVRRHSAFKIHVSEFY